MKMYRIAAAVCAAAVMFGCLLVFADGAANVTTEPAAAEPVSITDGISAESCAVYEAGTGTFLAQSNSSEIRSISHLAKLMTVLIAAENIESGKLSPDDTVSVSAHANSMNGTQIWLDIGEKITVDELLKAVTVGNANDACTALAENIGGSEESFVTLMNKKAALLGMKNTKFADCTGVSSETVSTADDLSLLSAQLCRYDILEKYFTTWIDTVRGGKTELVNTNRLIRTYSGAFGLKTCSGETSGECVIAAASRGDMKVCAVLLGCKTDDERFSDTKKVLDRTFSSFEIYTPEYDEAALADIKVKGGEKHFAKTEFSGITPIVIPKGSYPSIQCSFERADSVDAPVKKGGKVGSIAYTLNGNTILSGDIIVSEQVRKIKMPFAVKKVLLNLLNL